ncbi:hypothetical protein [Microvirga sp. VF16]|uniref:hypothetical protein n=1 Tax=Microvirga sp. VF16 TaxID=2807101 RepID=UPI00193E723E|nr:hypothetical protein [Microvirga sp. VF16]
MAGRDPESAYLTFSYRVKDATSGKHLVALGIATNTVWNYVNEIGEWSTRRGPKWATGKQLRDLTKGASKELGVPSQVIKDLHLQAVEHARHTEKAGPKARRKVEVRQIRQNLSEGTADTAAPGGRKAVPR